MCCVDYWLVCIIKNSDDVTTLVIGGELSSSAKEEKPSTKFTNIGEQT